MDRAEVGVLEEADQVRLAGFLERQDSQRLEAQVWSSQARVLTVSWCGSQPVQAAAQSCSRPGHKGAARRTCLEVLGDLAHEALEGQFADEQLGAA